VSLQIEVRKDPAARRPRFLWTVFSPSFPERPIARGTATSRKEAKAAAAAVIAEKTRAKERAT
jgi:dsRNA-specific ribonuclease